jgi:hypothetical protein
MIVPYRGHIKKERFGVGASEAAEIDYHIVVGGFSMKS